jgi:nitrogen fixation/metabolism regulation signal transduction histidine kinase
VTRLERKLLLALLVAALAPLAAATFFGRSALRDAYSRGVNPLVEEQLAAAVVSHHDHIVALREASDRTADAITQHWQLHAALREGDMEAVRQYAQSALSTYPQVAAVRVYAAAPNPSGEPSAPLVDVAIESRADPQQVRTLERERHLDTVSPPVDVVVVVTSPHAVFADLQRAGEVTEVYSRLLVQTDYVSDVYVWVLAGYLAFVIALALTVSIVLARRVSKRVLALADATERVGQGDMAVSVPDDDDDEIGELTRAFNRMVGDLRDSRERIDYLQRISAWQEFARRLAHEIKNPLTPIQLAAQEVAQAYRGDDARFARMLDDARAIIEEEVATLRRLVGEFSNFARLPEVDLAEADLVELLRDLERGFPSVLQDVYGETTGAPSVALVLDVPRTPLLGTVDAMMLKRCLDNLVRNAVEAIAGEAREGTGTVTLRLRRVDALLELAVSDDGPGIEASARARVFDPYFTTKSSGTGLGLAIVKKVVLEHQGRIACEAANAEGQPGTRFVITLPLTARRAIASAPA